ncbi:MAG TPA: hypothetical protein VFV99_31870 [Kofleriaceae bacterium]|nr:hypothetical protein [Kofleriaceae bacterium]
MIDIGREIASTVRADWNDVRREVVWIGLRARRRRRTVMRIACVSAMAAVALVSLREPHDKRAAPLVDVVADESAESLTAIKRAVPVERPPTHEPQPAASSGEPAVPSRRRVIAQRAEFSTWRELARVGEYERAYEVLDGVHENADDLLMIADVMRLSHHPAEATEPLRRVVRDHADDPRASLAAFTLGRVLLDDLGEAREAAGAFADAIRLAPQGPLAEDALARRVEALARAGDTDEAHALAFQYLDQFPRGRWLRMVRRFGGL